MPMQDETPEQTEIVTFDDIRKAAELVGDDNADIFGEKESEDSNNYKHLTPVSGAVYSRPFLQPLTLGESDDEKY